MTREFVREKRPSGLPSKDWAWVYVVTNQVNGKQYVGVTGFSVRRRWRRHVNRSGADKPRNGNCPALHAAIRKYGENSFACVAIFAGSDWQATLDAEVALIAAFKTIAPNGYNVTAGGEGVRGITFTEAELKRRSDFANGRVMSEDTRRRMSESSKGRKLSDEHIAKLKSRTFTKETRQKISEANTGRVATAEQRARMSLASTGRIHSNETKAKMSAWQIGKKLSQETKDKIRDKALARH